MHTEGEMEELSGEEDMEIEEKRHDEVMKMLHSLQF